MVLVLNLLNSWGMDGSFGRENSEQSVLSQIGRFLTPAFKPMGIEHDNWPATVGIFTGVLAKEAVVGTLDALYSQMASTEKTAQPKNFDLVQSLLDACQTVPDNLRAIMDKLFDPLGLNLGDLSDQSAMAAKQQVNAGTFAVMQNHFDGKTGAFAYLLFILLYAPCVAATAAIYKECGGDWTLFVVCWTSFIAYLTATLFYQGMTYAQHPGATIAWTIALTGVFSAVLLGLRYYGSRQISSIRP